MSQRKKQSDSRENYFTKVTVSKAQMLATVKPFVVLSVILHRGLDKTKVQLFRLIKS